MSDTDNTSSTFSSIACKTLFSLSHGNPGDAFIASYRQIEPGNNVVEPQYDGSIEQSAPTESLAELTWNMLYGEDQGNTRELIFSDSIINRRPWSTCFPCRWLQFIR
uniref:Uncharacterized protein n=1 Tax=Glossina pallidipes TaxID=7398 RepID=A0A1B0A4J7_GLOPL